MNCSTLDFKQAPDVGVELEDSTAVQLQQDLTVERKWLSVFTQSCCVVLLDTHYSLFKMMEANLVLTVYDTFSLLEY